MTPNELARKLGTEDGTTTANEGREDGTYHNGGSSHWDSNLINALGNAKARAAFGLEGDLSPSEDPIYSEALQAYSDAATEAYDAEPELLSETTQTVTIEVLPKCEACGGDGIAAEANYDGEGAAEEPCAHCAQQEATPCQS